MHRAFFAFVTFVTGSMMKGCPGHLVHLVNSATKRYPSSAAISSSSNSNSPSSIYITPPVAAFSFVTSRRRRLVAGLVPRTAGLVPAALSPSAASLVVSPSLQRFPQKSAIAKFRNARQTKMADDDSNIQKNIQIRIYNMDT